MRISDWSSDVCSSDLSDDLITRSVGAQARNACLCAHRSLSLRDSEALQAEGADRVAAQELPDLLVGEAGLGADVVGHLLRVREGAVEIGRASCRERECWYV